MERENLCSKPLFLHATAGQDVAPLNPYKSRRINSEITRKCIFVRKTGVLEFYNCLVTNFRVNISFSGKLCARTKSAEFGLDC